MTSALAPPVEAHPGSANICTSAADPGKRKLWSRRERRDARHYGDDQRVSLETNDQTAVGKLTIFRERGGKCGSVSFHSIKGHADVTSLCLKTSRFIFFLSAFALDVSLNLKNPPNFP